MKSRGFSLVGTLLSVVVGAVLAALLATAVNAYIKSRRVSREHNDLADFYHAVKMLLMTDASCQALLSGLPFSPVFESQLRLAAGYGENPRGPIGKGFKFSGGKMSVDEFTLTDKGIPPVSFDLLGKSVTRYMARVKLKVMSSDGTDYSARFFELPVLVDSTTHKIKTCNNEFNIGDACEALGFKWESTTSTCQPSSACLTGGTYIVAAGGLFGDAGCKIANPATRSCTCPQGYSDVPSGSVDVAQHCGRYCFSTYNTVHQCLRCAP